MRRRPSWGRGIIRKKKIHKKGIEEEGPEIELEVTGPSDSCLTQDEESSCDTNGPQTNGHLPSTEEESSNEPPDAAEAQMQNADEQLKDLASKVEESVPKECETRETPSQLHCLGDSSQTEVEGVNKVDPRSLNERSESSDTTAQTKHTDGFLVSRMHCVNGSESMDSMDSQTLKGSSEAVKITSQIVGKDSTKTPELDEHNATNEREPTQQHLSQDMKETTENVEGGQDKEGCSKDRECKRNLLEGQGESAEIEEPQSALPHPPVVIDHQRLSALLDLVVEKSEGYSVEQLERLYSLLSQCIYQHRREYDKTRLLEGMEERIHHFDTFL